MPQPRPMPRSAPAIMPTASVALDLLRALAASNGLSGVAHGAGQACGKAELQPLPVHHALLLTHAPWLAVLPALAAAVVFGLVFEPQTARLRTVLSKAVHRRPA